MNRRRRRAQRMYRLLVRLYPAAHRRAFGEQMVQAFGDHYRDAVQCRGGSRLRFWLAALADAGTSLATEHAAELRARVRRRREASRNRSARRAFRREVGRRRGGGNTRRRRARPRLRYRRSVGRGRLALLVVTLLLVGAGFGTGMATGRLGLPVLAAVLLVTAWLGYAIRLARRRVPVGPRGNGPAPPGGAGVREPRRPLPLSPAGAAALPMPDQDPPGQAAAAI